ncbi:tetratricopeptide repeat protein 19, mitochondrial isoform X2 [Stegostoma tigrinum]|uniref:tetratricopeptide repeat protein 19, mitochondrial isoform X2 n=1 Tax=Stegostoma tigrinum TaxID=3053191 RepID=UPI0028708638|nr:tetratricopeptide repeat protein 19, mitochondrial isoform X2 [Stegostoma tigrinum]
MGHGACQAVCPASWAFLAAIQLFSHHEKEQQDPEDAIILLIKKSKLSAMTGELEDADRYLHQALKLAQQSQNNQAITYTYTQMANLAFLRGDLLNAEKLFKAAMSQLLQAGTPEDDNAMIEMSLKLCSIYVSTEQHGLAVEGYKWCIETLEEKVQREKDVPEVSLSAAEKDNTRLLLGMCLDSCARYMMSQKQLVLAESLYEQALAISQQVQGETHPQTVVLMNDLATVLDMKGHQDRAYEYVTRASNLARETSHPDQCVILSNLARVLMHRGQYDKARCVYEEALTQAESKADMPVIQHIRSGMEELKAKAQKSQEVRESSH